MSLPAPPRYLDAAAWEATFEHEEFAFELVAGVPTVSPPETGTNILAAVLLYDALTPLISSTHRLLPNCGVHLRSLEGRDTVRQPDLAVLPRDVDLRRSFLPAAEVIVVVEVVSPSSLERDWVAKRAEYARGGIPAYLIVDVRGTDPHVWLFDTIHDGAYADPTGDGASVTLRIPGAEPITITATDLVG